MLAYAARVSDNDATIIIKGHYIISLENLRIRTTLLDGETIVEM